MMRIHNTTLDTNGISDAETLSFWRDLAQVMCSVHQGMSICGPWMEARVKAMIRGWLPAGWVVSGPSQVYRADLAGIRSRSWDAVVHRELEADNGLPPPASPESGWPLVPLSAVAAVIDTKTNFGAPTKYAAQSVFNLMNDATDAQLAFLGDAIPKIILAASSSSGSPNSLKDRGAQHGLMIFSLGRYSAGPVSDGANRMSRWKLETFSDGSYPLQAFKATIVASLSPQNDLAHQ